MASRARKRASGGGGEGPLRDRLPAKASRGSAAGDYAEECLTSIARILVSTGHSPTRLSRTFSDICSDLKEPARRFEPTQLRYFTDVPHVIALWHSDPDYLDSRGQPIPLPLRSKGRSLSALIERVLPGEDPAAVVKSLKRMNGLRRRGALYLPTGRYCIYPPDTAPLHSLSALRGVLRTFDHNLEHRGSMKLFERAVRNPSFPARALPAFNRQVNPLALELLQKLDGEMQVHERSSTGGPRTRVGVAVIVFENPPRNQSPKPGRAEVRAPRHGALTSRGRRKGQR